MSKKLNNIPQYKYDTFNPYIFASIPLGKKVLDVGCGTGLLGHLWPELFCLQFLIKARKEK